MTSGVTAVGMGIGHTCAVANGGAFCWGSNSAGQLGDDSTTKKSAPVAVKGLDTGVKDIAAGTNHSCARSGDGSVRCWGDNTFGQLGDGTGTSSKVPVLVEGLGKGISAIACGGYLSCALSDAGAVLCWGYNAYGEVGDGTKTMRLKPTEVLGLGGKAKAIGVGTSHACALREGGVVQCWGRNNVHQLGDGTDVDRATPKAVQGLPANVGVLGVGTYNACGVATGALHCWGNNGLGQLGDLSRWKTSPQAVLSIGP